MPVFCYFYQDSFMMGSTYFIVLLSTWADRSEHKITSHQMQRLSLIEAYNEEMTDTLSNKKKNVTEFFLLIMRI